VQTGTIRRLEKYHGFGFIKMAGGKDLFFHRSAVEGSVFYSLKEGQSVEFKIGLGSKGLQAFNVRITNEGG